VIRELKQARRHLERSGWVGPALEPWCRDSRGRPVHHSDEGVQTFSCSGALQLAGADVGEAFELLGRIVSPSLATLRAFEAKYSFEELLDLLHEDERPRPCYLELEAEWFALHERAVGDFLTFGGWLVQDHRKPKDVLRAFSAAVTRSAREPCT
jgi:hypothetical protein